MSIEIKGDRLFLKNRHAWATWLLNGILLIVPIAFMYLFWFSDISNDPTMAVRIVMTAVSLLMLYYLPRRMMEARTASAVFDLASGSIHVLTRSMRGSTAQILGFDEVDRIEFRTTDNDGEFHKVVLVFGDGTEIPVTQGSFRRGVEGQRDLFLEFLRKGRPELQSVDLLV